MLRPKIPVDKSRNELHAEINDPDFEYNENKWVEFFAVYHMIIEW